MANHYNREIHHRRSVRINGYDYSQPGAYFITICAWQRDCLFGDIIDGEMVLNEYGGILNKCWHALPDHYPHVELDAFSIMPNHVHGIIMINTCRGEVASPPLIKGGKTPPLHKPTLGQIVAFFKYQSTKQINTTRNTQGRPVWQRNYYEHVIRNDPHRFFLKSGHGDCEELFKIRQYIQDNPLNWSEDVDNPTNIP